MPDTPLVQTQLLGLGTAAPAHVIAQDAAAAAAASIFGGKVFRTPDLLKLFDNTGIKTRRTVKPLDWYARPCGWSERNEAYIEGAEALYMEAAGKALAAAGLRADEIGTVVTVSSTGIATPSLEARLHGRLGLSPSVKRCPVFGLGCAGGVSGLALAARLAKAEPGKPVLLVVVELCSLACRADEATKANVVATALFGDGAAAAVLRAGPPEPGARPIEADSQHLWPDTLDIMGWTIDPVGFGIVLASTLPAFVQKRFGEAISGFAAERGEGAGAVGRYVCHPGGARVLPALEEVIGLPVGAMDIEREVLAEYGNMSAPTVWFVLERVLQRIRDTGEDPGRLVMAALGPGFTASFVSLGETVAPAADARPARAMALAGA